MPRAQRNLDFKVKKSSTITRSRSKRIANKENVNAVPKLLSEARNEENEKLRNGNSDGLSSPKSAKILTYKAEILPLSPSNLNRIPPLGYQALNVQSPKVQKGILTPSKQNVANLTPQSPLLSRSINNTPTPTKRRALTFSPAKENDSGASVLLSPKSVCILSKAKALDFSPSNSVSNDTKDSSPDFVSPTKKLKIDETGVTTPSRKSSRLQSPRVGKSPARRAFKLSSPIRQSTHSSKLLSPVRQSPRLLGSPLRRNDEKSTPGKRSVKKLTFAPTESVPLPAVLQSPKKACVVPEEVRRSPRKHQSPVRGLQSPMKMLQSPRKIQLLQEDVRRSPRKHNTPLRLARQEGLCYQKAKRALNTALPKKLLCREKQYKEVNDFLDKCLDKEQPGSLYISGAPGTGKTAVLSHTLQRLKEEKQIQVIYVNCMSVKNSQAIFNRVLGEITGKETSLSTKEAAKKIEKSLSSKGDMLCMIMDEVDQLDSKNQEVLYTMFEWPHLKNSRLVLIGIANALDLTDRILPRLQAKPKCKPKLMNFPPYSKDQIVTIIKDRLSQVEVEGEQVLDANAIQFCARKVAAVAGDMRKALDVCRRAIEMVESEVKKQQIIMAAKSPSKRTSVSAVPKKIGVAHIMKTVNEVYGSHSSVQSNATQTIPLQQKLAICSLLLSLKKGKSKEVALGKLHENYSKVCKKQEVPGVDQSEFMSLCTLIEARGIMRVKKGKETRLAKVTLKIDEGELERALQDKTLVSSVLKNGL